MSDDAQVLAVSRCIAMVGLEPRVVRVECSLGPGLPGLRLVGLPDLALRESIERVRTAVQQQGLIWPGGQRTVVNLAPADLPKSGSGFDLPIAAALLAATGQVPRGALEQVWSIGELGLDGRVRPVPGVLPVAAGAREAGAGTLLVAPSAAPEAALVDGLRVVAVRDLREVVEVLCGRGSGTRVRPAPVLVPQVGHDLVDVRGQPVARRALEIAAAGRHHLLLAGPPGCGKTMLARRLHGLLPPLEVGAALEVAAIHSLAAERRPDEALSLAPPLREPHHTVSVAGLVGGGSGIPRPGEISLAHHGLLLLDELLETPRVILDALRQPLERGEVVLTRARHQVRYPCEVLLVAATNPCPCGHLGSPTRACRCRPDRIERYRSRLSGPLLDRLDLHLEVSPIGREQLLAPPDGEDTATVAQRVVAARAAAVERWGAHGGNRDVEVARVRATAEPAALRTLAQAVAGLGLSARAFDRALRVSRTIADLGGSSAIGPAEVEEALAYRLVDLAVAP